MKLKNFRSYKNEISIDFNDLTVFVGKNDIGKSTLLEALDIFFNEGNGVIKLDKDDINKESLNQNNSEIVITAIFSELPEEVVIDATSTTSLADEYLLNESGELEVIKKYQNGGKEKIYLNAYHPGNEICSNLHEKTKIQLGGVITSNSIECENRNINAVMRKAIWCHYEQDLALENKEVEVNKGDTKEIWNKLKVYLPIYSLFQSDRKNSDGDSEIQDPLQEAVRQIIGAAELQEKLAEIAQEVETKLREVSQRTLEKLNEMSPEIAQTLTPVIPSTENLKWKDVFKKVAIAGDDSIPINKRGSGVKRLILLNFFRAEAERKLEEQNSESVIYAIEEPETSQHTDNQIKLLNAFKELAGIDNTQVLMTTHSANIVKLLDFDNLIVITRDNQERSLNRVSADRLPYPSLNEVNYLAFNEISDEYHNELYGFIEAEEQLNLFKANKPRIPYMKQLRNRDPRQEHIILTEYIRHQIHHPENNLNDRFNMEQLGESVLLMRSYISTYLANEE